MLLFQTKTEAQAIFPGFPFPFVCCKWKTERASFRLFPANGKRKFVFLSRQTRSANGNQRLLFQQTAIYA
jgi:hypothetical protein